MRTFLPQAAEEEARANAEKVAELERKLAAVKQREDAVAAEKAAEERKRAQWQKEEHGVAVHIAEEKAEIEKVGAAAFQRAALTVLLTMDTHMLHGHLVAMRSHA